jgi:hypothetical protein
MGAINLNQLKANPNAPTVPPSLFNKAIDAMKMLQIGGSPDYRINRNAGGTILSLNFPNGNNVTKTSYTPYELISQKPVTSSSFKLTFEPGIINGNIYPKIGSNYMWQYVSTTSGSVTTYAYPNITANSGDYVYIQATVAAGVITDAIITHGSSDPSTLETDSLSTYIIGTLDASTGTWTQTLQGNLGYQAYAAYFAVDSGTRNVIHVWRPSP